MANDKIICKCYKVTEKDIKKAIKREQNRQKTSAKKQKQILLAGTAPKKFEKTVKDLLK